MPTDYADTDLDVLRTCLLELAQQARQSRTEGHASERDRIVTHAILEDITP
jgi:hypothetical protein